MGLDDQAPVDTAREGRPTTWRTSRSRPAARRSGGSPRCRRLRGLHDGGRGRPASVLVEVDAAPEVTVETVGRDDARVGKAVRARRPGQRPGVRLLREGDRGHGAARGRRRPSRPSITLRGAGEPARRLRPHCRRASSRWPRPWSSWTTTGCATYADNVEFVVGDGATLTVVSLQDWADDAVHVSAPPRPARPRTPRSRSFVVTLGGDLVRLVAVGVLHRPGRRRRAARRSTSPTPASTWSTACSSTTPLPNCRSNVDLQGRAAGRGRARGLDRRRASSGPRPRAPTPTSSTATWCSPTAPAPTRCRTWRSSPARSPGRATPAPPAASTTSTSSTSRPAASLRRGAPPGRPRLLRPAPREDRGRGDPRAAARGDRGGARPRVSAVREGRARAGRHPRRRRDRRARSATTPVALVRQGDEVFALHDVCSHAEVEAQRGRGLRRHAGVLAARLVFRPAHRQAHRAARHQARVPSTESRSTATTSSSRSRRSLKCMESTHGHP